MKRLGVMAGHRMDDRGQGVPLEGQPSAERPVHHGAEGEQIAARAHLLRHPPGLLGRHVVGGAHGGPRGGEPGARPVELGDAEVQQLGHLLLPRPLDEDVLRLDVPVHHPLLMGCLQARAHPGKQGQGPLHRQRALSLQELLQVLALEVLHHHEREALVGVVEVHHRHDVGMAQPGDDGRLLVEAPVLLAPRAAGDGEHLDREPLVRQARALGLVYRAHAAVPQQPQHGVAAAEGAAHKAFWIRGHLLPGLEQGTTLRCRVAGATRPAAAARRRPCPHRRIRWTGRGPPTNLIFTARRRRRSHARRGEAAGAGA